MAWACLVLPLAPGVTVLVSVLTCAVPIAGDKAEAVTIHLKDMDMVGEAL
jgi:hypothetical protein